MSFGEILRKLRDERGMSQEDLAIRLGISRNSIMNYETENEKQKTLPKHDTLLQIAEIFNVTTDYLLGRQDAQKRFFTDNDEDIDLYLNEIKSLLKQGDLPEEVYQSLTKYARFLVREHNDEYNSKK